MKALTQKSIYAIFVLAIVFIQFFLGRRMVSTERPSTGPSLFGEPQNTNAGVQLKIKNHLFVPPTKIVVWGERASGVNYASEVLRTAFGSPKVQLYEHVARQEPFQQDELDAVASQKDVLWIMVVRLPCDWAEAMIRQDGVDWSLESDTQEKNGTYYQDIFHLRQSKLVLMSQVMKTVPRHVKIVRLNAFERNPNVLVEEIVKEYHFKTKKGYKRYPPSNKIHSTICMEYGKWREAQSRIDWKIEGYFGYHSKDCHICYENQKGGSVKINSRNRDDKITIDQDKSVPRLDLRADPPSKIYLLGERNSGTTFVSKTLAEAFELPHDFEVEADADQFAIDIPVFLHKHMFRHDLLNDTELAEIKERTDILWIMVVRSPCDWIEGMYRKPYHLCPVDKPEKCGTTSKGIVWMNQNNVAKLSLKSFFSKMEWVDWAESAPFPRMLGKKRRNAPKMVISKVTKNYTYPNIIALRKHKMELMKQVMNVAPRNVKIVRLTEVERNPNIFIQDLVSEFSLKTKKSYQPLQPSVVSHTATCFTPEEWETVQELIDWDLEGEFGYNPFDCRMCYGYDKSLRYGKRRKTMMKRNNKIKYSEKKSA